MTRPINTAMALECRKALEAMGHHGDEADCLAWSPDPDWHAVRDAFNKARIEAERVVDDLDRKMTTLLEEQG